MTTSLNKLIKQHVLTHHFTPIAFTQLNNPPFISRNGPTCIFPVQLLHGA